MEKKPIKPKEIRKRLIVNTDEFLERLHRRYIRIRIETILECIELTKFSTSPDEFNSILRLYLTKNANKATEDIDVLRNFHIRASKRGSGRCSNRSPITVW